MTRWIGLAMVTAGACTGVHTDATPDAASDAAVSTAAPQLTIGQPTDLAVITGSRRIEVTGSIVAPRAIRSVTATVGGAVAGAVTFTNTSFSVLLTLGDNDQMIAITAIDDLD